MKEFDVIIFGATGFTGQLCATYLAQHPQSDNIRWAIAGRNQQKLEAVRSKLGEPFQHLPIFVADSKDEQAIEALVVQTKVVATTVGPFALYGEALVKKCAEHGTHYVDITGETQFVRRMIDQYQEQAVRSGAKIVPFCGFDSCPSDLGTLFVAKKMKELHNTKVRTVRAVFSAKGGFNGGTLLSALNLFDEGVWKDIQKPFYLNEQQPGSDEVSVNQDYRWPVYVRDLKRWTAPFFMAPVNTRVVRKTQELSKSKEPLFATDFSYNETMTVGKTFALPASFFTAFTLQSFGFLSRSKSMRNLFRKLGPKSGEGPSQKEIEEGFFRTYLFAEGEEGQKLSAKFQSKGDPGNKVTITFLMESALCLALDEAKLAEKHQSGFLTPATAMGEILIKRVCDAGMTLELQ